MGPLCGENKWKISSKGDPADSARLEKKRRTDEEEKDGCRGTVEELAAADSLPLPREMVAVNDRKGHMGERVAYWSWSLWEPDRRHA